MLSKPRFVSSLNYVRSCFAQTAECKGAKARNVKPLKEIINYTDTKLRDAIPAQYFIRKPSDSISRLYLVDEGVAKSVADHVVPDLLGNKNQLVCDTNAGLGLITKELLTKGVKSVRLYERCTDFRKSLYALKEKFPNKAEVFNYNMYYLDAEWIKGSTRIEALLKDVPHKVWEDDPCMTIVGPMPNLHFIKYLLSALNNSHEILSHGRFQIFALMIPNDYLKCTSNPETAKNYSKFSVTFQNIFDYTLLEKYPRKLFLPWDLKSCQEVEYIYLVKISLKRYLPVPLANVSQFITFIEYCMKPNFPVIPFLEESFPGIGANLIVPKSRDKEVYFQNMSIFTEFRELLPRHWQQIFLQMLQRPEFNDFISLPTISQHIKNNNKIKDIEEN